MKTILTLPLAIPLALAGNRVRAAADWLEARNKAPRTIKRLEKLHTSMMYVLLWMQD